MFLIMKQHGRGIFLGDAMPHLVAKTRKLANKEVARLNERAQHYHYFVESIKEVKERK